MKAKQKKEIQELIYQTVKELKRITPCSTASTPEEDKMFRLDYLAKKDLFNKVKGDLPKVYLENFPTQCLPFNEWLSLITKAHLIHRNLDQDLLILFDNITLRELKIYFIDHLNDYYINKCGEELEKFNKIIKKELEAKKG